MKTNYRVLINNPVMHDPIYAWDGDIEPGTRVEVSFNGKGMVGIVWEKNPKVDFDPSKIKKMDRVLEEEPFFPEHWRRLMGTVSSYYHYPLGPTVFTGVPRIFSTYDKRIEALRPYKLRLSSQGLEFFRRRVEERKEFKVVEALFRNPLESEGARTIYRNAAKFLEKSEMDAAIIKNILNPRIMETWICLSKEVKDEVFELDRHFSFDKTGALARLFEDAIVEKRHGGSSLGANRDEDSDWDGDEEGARYRHHGGDELAAMMDEIRKGMSENELALYDALPPITGRGSGVFPKGFFESVPKVPFPKIFANGKKRSENLATLAFLALNMNKIHLATPKGARVDLGDCLYEGWTDLVDSMSELPPDHPIKIGEAIRNSEEIAETSDPLSEPEAEDTNAQLQAHGDEEGESNIDSGKSNLSTIEESDADDESEVEAELDDGKTTSLTDIVEDDPMDSVVDSKADKELDVLMGGKSRKKGGKSKEAKKKSRSASFWRKSVGADYVLSANTDKALAALKMSGSGGTWTTVGAEIFGKVYGEELGDLVFWRLNEERASEFYREYGKLIALHMLASRFVSPGLLKDLYPDIISDMVFWLNKGYLDKRLQDGESAKDGKGKGKTKSKVAGKKGSGASEDSQGRNLELFSEFDSGNHDGKGDHGIDDDGPEAHIIQMSMPDLSSNGKNVDPNPALSREFMAMHASIARGASLFEAVSSKSAGKNGSNRVLDDGIPSIFELPVMRYFGVDEYGRPARGELQSDNGESDGSVAPSAGAYGKGSNFSPNTNTSSPVEMNPQGRRRGVIEMAPPPSIKGPSLTEDQRRVKESILKDMGRFACHLLHGITGSGKTEVYFEIMEECLARGAQALFLLPEINLTPQFHKRFDTRFPGVPSAILHSAVADVPRAKSYLAFARGDLRILIGTRLSVFTPVRNLGLVVVDEEHDLSFKQNNLLRYNARDVAVWLARQHGCPVILGSATPSLESYDLALRNVYKLDEMTRRAVANSTLPSVFVHDVDEDEMTDGISGLAVKMLRENLANGGLSVVFINRRGYAPVFRCGECDNVVSCPNCSCNLVVHLKAGVLKCHHCDHTEKIPRRCPCCGSDDMSPVGEGTQRTEDALARMIPEARIVRVDSDSTGRKNSWREIYNDVNEGKVDILVGTQMLTKGHDFDKLNLVVVLNADSGLFSSWYKSKELLFQTLVQVAGRSGRRGEKGVVLLQTTYPDNPIYEMVRNQDYRSFALDELEQRRQYDFPPFVFNAIVRSDAKTYEEAESFIKKGLREFVQRSVDIPEFAPGNLKIYGPVPHSLRKLKNRERCQLFFESHKRKYLHGAISLMRMILVEIGKEHPQLNWSIDIDPLEE